MVHSLALFHADRLDSRMVNFTAKLRAAELVGIRGRSGRQLKTNFSFSFLNVNQLKNGIHFEGENKPENCSDALIFP